MKKIHFFKNMFLLVGVLFVFQLSSQSFPPAEREIGAVIKSDYLINDDVVADLPQKEKSATATNSSGAFVIVWSDERNGEFDIFAQLYHADGTKIGNNFRVNDDGNDLEDLNPAVAMNDNGDFVVAWQGRRWNDIRVFARQFNSDGTAQGSSILVPDDEDSPHALMPAIAINNKGWFAIAWNDTRLAEDDVYAQLFNENGQRIGSNVAVNNDGVTEYGLVAPGIGISNVGNFVVTWSDDRKKWANVMAQKFSADGTADGSNFYVNDQDACDSTAQMRPSIDMNSDGEFIICWDDRRAGIWGSGDPEIWAQRFNESGDMIGDNFKITDYEGDKHPQHINLSMNNSGKFVISWTDDIEDFYGDCYAQCFNASGSPAGERFRVDDWDRLGIQEFPSIGLSHSNELIISFCDDQPVSGSRIAAIRYSWSAEVIQNSWTVNDDEGANFQDRPATAINENGEVVTVWQDNRDDMFFDIFLQRYDKNAIPIGENIKVNDDSWGGVPQYTANLALNAKGNHVATWVDERNGSADIYGQFFLSPLRASDANFKVNDDSGGWKGSPDVGMDGEGNFIIVWEDDRNQFYDIYAQRYQADGTPIGSNYLVHEPHSRHQMGPVIAMNKSGQHVIAWSDERVYPRRIFARIFEPDGTPVGESFNCSDYMENTFQNVPAIDIDDEGNFVIAWQDERNYWRAQDAEDIYARFFDADGTPSIDEFRVHDDDTDRKQINPSVALSPDGNEQLIIWTDYRKENGNPDIQAQKFVNGVPDENGNVMINKPDDLPYNHQRSFQNSVAANNEMVTYAFLDNRRHKHWDCSGKLTDWGLVGNEEKEASFDLLLYPNPASAVMALQSVAFSQQKSYLEIFDLNGKKLIEQHILKGTSIAEIDVSNLMKGVYFCRLTSGSSSTTKKLIIR